MEQTQDMKYFKTLYIRFNLYTEAYSFFIVVPGVLFYVWSNIQLSQEQYAIFNTIWPPAFVFGVIFVLVNNWIVLLPVMRYLKKYRNGEAVAPEEYERAKKRLVRLPVIHAVGAFFRWIFLMANAIVPFTIIVDLSRPQIVNLWMGVAICAFLGIISYFSITEILVQGLLDRGAFTEKTPVDYTRRIGLLQRLTALSVTAVLLPMLLILTFFYITVEIAGVAGTLLYARLGIFALFSIIIGIFSPILLNRSIIERTRIVTELLKKIGGGDLSCHPREVPVHDEISQIILDVDEMKDRLRESRGMLLDLNLNLEKKVAERTEELEDAFDEIEAANNELEAMNENLIQLNRTLEENERSRKKEMALAAAVQASFLPGSPPADRYFDIAFTSRPWTEVSGDFFDFFEENASLKGLGLFDVSGHGVSSGLLTLVAKSTITRNFHLHREEKLGKVMEHINEGLIQEMGQTDNYVTGVLLRFDGDTVEYVNCASPDVIFRSGSSGKTGRVADRTGKTITSGFLGVAEMKMQFNALAVKLLPGDCLFMYTDCLIESRNPDGIPYQETDIMATLKKARGDSAREILDQIINDFDQFIQDTPVRDDLTAILIKRK
ncbi:MAG: SpoIIE family protein phosphatase [Spirochaetes bacterium]|nr:SpoIIE family protein phosphatase [Spirochaetota bacterium]